MNKEKYIGNQTGDIRVRPSLGCVDIGMASAWGQANIFLTPSQAQELISELAKTVAALEATPKS